MSFELAVQPTIKPDAIIKTSDLTLLDRALSSDKDLWPVFSYSRLQVWDRCEEAYKYSYVDEILPVGRPKAASVGAMSHEVLQIFYELVVAGRRDEVNEKVDEYFKQVIAEAQLDHARLAENFQIIATAGRITKDYIRRAAPRMDKLITPMWVEQHFMLPWRTPKGYKFYFQGYVDLVGKLNNGKYFIMDHKTTSQKKFWSENELEMDPQMELYCFALSQMYGIDINLVYVNFLNTYEYAKPADFDTLFHRMEAVKSNQKLAAVFDQFVLKIEEILDKSEEDTYKMSLRRECANCGFRPLCLAKLQGYDPSPLIRGGRYIQKESSRTDINMRVRGIIG